MFVWRLDAADRISIDDVERYGVTSDQLLSIKTRFTEWAEQLRNPLPATPASSDQSQPERPPTQSNDQGIER